MVSTPPGDTPSPPPGLLVADFFSQGAGYRSRRRMGTRDWLITFTVGGRGLYRLAGQEFGCGPGDVMLLQPGTPHDYGTEPETGRWDFYWAHFLPRPTWNPWLLWRELASGLRSVAVGEASTRRRIEEVFARLLRDVSALDPWGERLAENALEEVILLVAGENARSSGEIIDPRVAQVVQEISRRYREPMTVAELAAEGASVALSAGASVQGGGRRITDPDAAAAAAAPGGAPAGIQHVERRGDRGGGGLRLAVLLRAPVPRAVRDESDRVSSGAPAEPRNHVICAAAHAEV